MTEFVNKRVEVLVPERDERGKVIPTKYTTVCGLCTFVGKNDILGWPLMIVVNRGVFTIRTLADVKII